MSGAFHTLSVWGQRTSDVKKLPPEQVREKGKKKVIIASNQESFYLVVTDGSVFCLPARSHKVAFSTAGDHPHLLGKYLEKHKIKLTTLMNMDS